MLKKHNVSVSSSNAVDFPPLVRLVLLLAEMAAFGQAGFASSWSAQYHVATSADSGDLGVREDGLERYKINVRIMNDYYNLDFITARAFDVHKIRIRTLH